MGFIKNNYTSNEDAMKNFTVAEEEVEEIAPENAQGEVITPKQEEELEQKMAEFSEAEPITNDGDVYNVLLVGVDRRDTSWVGNSDSMIDIIDKVGGVELTLSKDEVRVANNYVTEMCNLKKLDPTSYYFIQEGTKTCSGIQAVAYARIRYVGNADYERTERQRTVLTKIMEKMKNMSITELYAFAEDVLPLVTHNIPEDEMWGLLAKAPSIFQYDLVKDRIPYDGMYKVIYVKKQDMLVPDWESTIAKLKETLY